MSTHLWESQDHWKKRSRGFWLVFATRTSRVFEGLVEVFLWNKQCIWNKSFRDPEFLKDPRTLGSLEIDTAIFWGGFGWVRWWKRITTCFPSVLLGFRKMSPDNPNSNSRCHKKSQCLHGKWRIFERNAWDRMDASRVGKFKVVLGEFSGHERRWRIHLLVEGSLGWKVGLKWRWNYDQNLMIYKKVAYRTKWFLTNKIFSQLRRTLVFEGDNFHRFSLKIFDIQKFCSISTSK